MSTIESKDKKFEEALDKLISIDKQVLELHSHALEALSLGEDKVQEYIQEIDWLMEERKIISAVVIEYKKPIFEETTEDAFDLVPLNDDIISIIMERIRDTHQLGIHKETACERVPL